MLNQNLFTICCWLFPGLALLGLQACESSPSLEFTPMSSPAGLHSLYPFLQADADRLLLSWLEEKPGGETRLMYAESAAGEWSVPAQIASGSDWFVNWADFPAFHRFADGALVAHYLAKNGPGTYDYGVQVALGASGQWQTLGYAHADTSKAEHGFASFFPISDTKMGVVWLDGRKYAQGQKEMTLRATQVHRDGQIDLDQELDGRVCDCCQTDAVKTDRGVIVVYRDRSEGEIRDFSRVLYQDGAWSAPAPVWQDHWEIAGCPVNGPAVAAQGNRVAVAGFTKAQDTARIRLAFSSDGGNTFAAPRRIDAGQPEGRVDLAFDSQGRLWISWLENRAGQGVILIRQADETSLGPIHEVAPLSAGRDSGFPMLAALGTDLFVAYTQSGDSSRVVLMRAAGNY